MDEQGIIHSTFPSVELPNQNVWNFLYPHLEKWKNLTFMVSAEGTQEYLTYGQYIEHSLCWAKELNQNFQDSEPPTVSLILPNVIEYFPLALGCMAVGAPVCLIKYDTVKDLAKFMITETKSSVVVIDSSVFEYYQDLFEGDKVTPAIYINGSITRNSFKNVQDILNSRNELDKREAGRCSPDDVAVIVYSSGTTGNPKGTVIPHRSLSNGTACTAQSEVCHFKIPDKDGQEVLTGSIPFCQIFGFKYYGMVSPIYGSKIINFDDKDELQLCKIIRKHRPTYLAVMYNIMENLSRMECGHVLTSLRIMLCVGSPSNPETFERITKAVGKPIIFLDCYGTTEMFAVAMNGRFYPHVQGRFIDIETSQTIKEPRQNGELLVKSPGRMRGYLNNKKATDDAIDSDGWFHTGDIGYFDQDFLITILDRFKDIIKISVGNKTKQVSPSQIESILKQHPFVADCGVVDAPDVASGEVVPFAFVVRRGSITQEELLEFMKDHTEEGMNISGIRFVEDLPRNHMGKLVRKFLREMIWYKFESHI